jgi:hypothetical protein
MRLGDRLLDRQALIAGSGRLGIPDARPSPASLSREGTSNLVGLSGIKRTDWCISVREELG